MRLQIARPRPKPVHRRRDHGLVVRAARERLEHAHAHVGRHARAAIVDHDAHERPALDRDLDPLAARRVIDRVAQQVVEHDRHRVGVDVGLDGRTARHLDRDVVLLRDDADAIGRGARDRAQIAALVHQPRRTRARQDEQLLDEAVHPPHLGERLVGDALPVIVLAGLAPRDLEAGRDHGERRAQLVRRVRRELGLRDDAGLHALQHGIERQRHLVERVAVGADR